MTRRYSVGPMPHRPFWPGTGMERPSERSLHCPTWEPDHWDRLPLWLEGVDLFNYGFWWEAHEVWEALWKSAAGDSAFLLRGLIQSAAALLKVRVSNPRGAILLSQRSQATLAHLPPRPLMGLEVGPLRHQWAQYWASLPGLPDPGRHPRLRLKVEEP